VPSCDDEHVKEVSCSDRGLPVLTSSFLACLATILELTPDALPRPAPGEDAATGWTVSRWLGGLGLGLAAIADPPAFSWPGPWIGQAGASGRQDRRCVVMYGVPSGVVWDPAGGPLVQPTSLEAGFLVAAADIALALPPRPTSPVDGGIVESIWVAPGAAEPARRLEKVRALEGRGLAGDRHMTGRGTFPSGLPGSALTLIEAEVCDSFDPPLSADEHRRNVVTRGIELNRLVGHTFSIGGIRCRGMRLCEPCTVVQRYASRPVLRELVHRGGLRADILEGGEISVGDRVLASS
jgi:hypothetical protein